MTSIPDYIEPMVAYRAFDRHGAELHSTAQTCEWQREMEATCRAGGDHPAPSEGCSCGIWSLKRLPDVLRHFTPEFGDKAYAKIEVYGRVFEGQLPGYGPGFKSQKARIVEIYVPESVPGSVRYKIYERYGVPIKEIPPPNPFDLLEKKVDAAINRAHNLISNWQNEMEVEALKREAAALGKVEKWDSLKSRAHAYAYVSQGRSGHSRPLCNNTRLEITGADVGLRLHQTYVATYTKEGLVLNTGSWWTVTTKDRINMAARACTDFDVYSTGEGYGCWAAYKRGWWNLTREGEIPPWLAGEVSGDDYARTRRGPKDWPAQLNLDGGEVSIPESRKISKRTENMLRRAWMQENGWEIPFSNGMVLPYKES